MATGGCEPEEWAVAAVANARKPGRNLRASLPARPPLPPASPPPASAHPPPPPASWQGDALYAMELALSLEKLNFQKLRQLHAVADANGDASMADFVEGELLGEQVGGVGREPGVGRQRDGRASLGACQGW